MLNIGRVKKRCFLILFTVLAGAAGPAAQAVDFDKERDDRVKESIDYLYYEIRDPAETGQTLKQSLDAATPVVKNGVKRHGENRWMIRWQTVTRPEGDLCTVEDVTVNLNALILLPELASADPEVQKAFNQYVALLQEHLLLHYVIAIQAANRIELDIINLPPAPDCETLQQQADDAARSVIKQHREKEQQLDEVTNYGAEQGVVLED